MTDLTPTEDLLLDLLASRHRLRDTPYHVATRHRPTLRRLADRGLIGFDNGMVENHDKAWLTEKGIVCALSPGHSKHLFPDTCRSFYMGPKTSERRADCRRRYGHKGEHRADWYVAGKKKFDVQKTTVDWVDDEAFGRASDVYGDEVRRHEAERRARFVAAIEELRPGADADAYMDL